MFLSDAFRAKSVVAHVCEESVRSYIDCSRRWESLGLARGGAHLGERDELPRSSMSHTNPLKILQTETMVPMVKYDAVVFTSRHVARRTVCRVNTTD